MQIVAKGLKFSYNKDAKFRRDALNGVDLVISDGDFFGIIGETGSGKSTFIQHLNGLIAVQEGSLTVGDFDLSSGVKKDKKRLKNSAAGWEWSFSTPNTSCLPKRCLKTLLSD